MNSGRKDTAELREEAARNGAGDVKNMKVVEADMDRSLIRGWRERIKAAHGLLRMGAIAVALSLALQGCFFWVDDDGYHHHGYHHGWHHEHSSIQPSSPPDQETAGGTEKL